MVLYASPASVSFLQVPELLKHGHSHKHGHKHGDSLKNACIQAEPSMPKGYNVSRVWEERDRIVDWLIEAVKIPTEVFDEMGPVDEDPKWKTMGTFQEYLERSFPRLYVYTILSIPPFINLESRPSNRRECWYR